MIPIGGVKRKLTLRVSHDSDVDSPAKDGDGQWTLYSFNRRHVDYKHPDEVGFDGLNDDGSLRIKKPGLRRKLEVGLAFVLSYFEHGRCMWSLAGSGPQCRWDTAQKAGLLVWEHKPGDMGARTYEERQKDAATFLKTYTAWCNGDCWWYDLQDEDGETVESSGGFIGESGEDLDHMWEAIRYAVGNDEIEFKAGRYNTAEDIREEYEKAAARASKLTVQVGGPS